MINWKRLKFEGWVTNLVVWISGEFDMQVVPAGPRGEGRAGWAALAELNVEADVVWLLHDAEHDEAGYDDYGWYAEEDHGVHARVVHQQLGQDAARWHEQTRGTWWTRKQSRRDLSISYSLTIDYEVICRNWGDTYAYRLSWLLWSSLLHTA